MDQASSTPQRGGGTEGRKCNAAQRNRPGMRKPVGRGERQRGSVQGSSHGDGALQESPNRNTGRRGCETGKSKHRKLEVRERGAESNPQRGNGRPWMEAGPRELLGSGEERARLAGRTRTGRRRNPFLGKRTARSWTWGPGSRPQSGRGPLGPYRLHLLGEAEKRISIYFHALGGARRRSQTGRDRGQRQKTGFQKIPLQNGQKVIRKGGALQQRGIDLPGAAQLEKETKPRWRRATADMG